MALSGCGGSGGGTGTLNLNITDAAIDDAAHVYVQFSSVEINGPGGTQSVTFDAPKQIDLLALQGSGSQSLLDGITVTAGRYQWIRLGVDTDDALDTYIEMGDGSQHELTIPSASQTGLKLVSTFTVPADGAADFTIDFDLRKSVHTSGMNYVLRPTLRLIDNSDMGHIAGTVDGTLLSTNCGADTDYAVYVFAGAGATPDDEGSSNAPVSSALVSLANSVYSYEAGYLDAGDYTVALTCQAGADDPGSDDQTTFIAQSDVSVTAGQTTTHNFE